MEKKVNHRAVGVRWIERQKIKAVDGPTSKIQISWWLPGYKFVPILLLDQIVRDL